MPRILEGYSRLEIYLGVSRLFYEVLPLTSDCAQQNINWLQPTTYAGFRCIGADCEDTCCSGMAVAVDEATFGKYQACSHSTLQPKLQQLVRIQPNPTTAQYARIQPEQSFCPFLSEKLCSIQQELGSDYLSDVCSTYPRVIRKRPQLHERSLDLSCPEAARLVLSNAQPLQLEVASTAVDEIRGSYRVIPSHLHEDDVRSLLLNILQNRRFPIAHRVTLVGHVCAKLSELIAENNTAEWPEMLQGFGLAIDGGFFNAHLVTGRVSAASQLAIVAELLLCRTRLDYTSPRLLGYYQEFTTAMGFNSSQDFDAIAARYVQADDQHLEPFLKHYSHVFEHYLVSYAFKTMLPFGTETEVSDLGKVVAEQYLLMAAHFAVLRALVTGVAANRGAAFQMEHAIGVIQAFSRNFEHCVTYPEAALALLHSKGIAHPGAGIVLTQNLRGDAVKPFGIPAENLFGVGLVEA